MAERDTIVAYLDDLLRIGDFADQQPNGLQVPGRDQVGKVAIGVSGQLELFERAADAGADLVLVHHGIFWDFMPRQITPQLKQRLKVLFDADMSLAAYHLPLDGHAEVGNNALLCEMLGFERDPTPFGLYKGRAIGMIGRSTEGVPVAELKRRISGELEREPFLFEAGPDPIRSIGFVSGAATGLFAEAIDLGLDAFLTGEPAEHVMADARESKTHYIAAGHYATETVGAKRLGELLSENFGVESVFIDVPNPI